MPGLERTLEMTILIRAINQTTGAFGGVRLAAVAALGATAAALAYSVKQAADFQAGLTTLATGAGEAANKLQQVGDGIKQVSINTGTTTDDLIKSMFLIESAGFRGATGVQVLQTAAEGAKVGNTDLAKTTQVLLTMLHDYHQPASQAVADTNSIIATVKNGTMTMDDLNGAMKNVLSIASAFHIKLSDVEGALATMSVAGDKGSAAGTHLAMMLRMLSNPATTAANEMAAMGINSINLANEMRISLPLALQEIETAVAKHFTPGSVEFNRAVTTILGGTRSGVAGLELMNANLPIFRANARSAADAAATAGNNVNGWALVQQDFNQKLSETQAGLNVAAIDLGTLLLPVLGKVLDALNPLIAQFTNWVETSQGLHTAITGIGDFMAGTLVPALANGVTWVGNIAQAAGNLFQAFQQGQGYANALVIALVSMGVAIKVIDMAELVGQTVNFFDALSSGSGIIVNLATKLFPELAVAIGGFTTTTALMMGAATAGISLLVGAIIAGIVATAVAGQNAIRGMTQQTQQSYNALGNSYADTQIKMQVHALETGRTQEEAAANASGNATSRWQLYKTSVQQASDDALARFLLDQQRMADAAAKYASDAAASWSNFIAQMHAQGIDPINGGPWSPTSGTQRGGPHRPGGPVSGGPIWLPTPPGAGGPRPPGHAAGIFNSPFGHWATVGERGPELMYVPRGANIYPSGTGPSGGGGTINVFVSTMAGSRTEVMRMVDLIEQEIGHRFRNQTNSFTLSGLA